MNKHPEWYDSPAIRPGDSMTRFVVGEARNLKIGLFTQSGPEGDIL